MKKNYGSYIDKVENFENLSQIEQVKYISFFYKVIEETDEFTSYNISKVFDDENLSMPSNTTDCLNKLCSRNPPILIKKNNLYRFHRNAQKLLEQTYLDNKHSREISETLRSLISKVSSPEQKSFLEEAITCFEIKAYRASIIMAWLLTVDILYAHVLNHKLSDFNSALSKHSKYNAPIPL